MADKPHWKYEPDDHDFPAALDYLQLILPNELARAALDALRSSELVTKKAKDLLRASALPLLGSDNVHVAFDLDKVRRGEKLSPVLLISGDLVGGWPLTIADGYHRICASHHLDENAEVPCRLAALPS